MRSRLAERIHPTEIEELRAVAEAKPLPAPPAPKPPNWGRNMITFLHAEAPVERPSAFFNAIDPTPIPHANWSTWLADDWSHIDGRWDNLADALARESVLTCTAYEYSLSVVMTSLLASVAQLNTVDLPECSAAYVAAAESELAWIDAEMAVAL